MNGPLRRAVGGRCVGGRVVAQLSYNKKREKPALIFCKYPQPQETRHQSRAMSTPFFEEELLSMSTHTDMFGARARLKSAFGDVTYFRLGSLAQRGIKGMEKLPYTVRIILENV